MHTFESFVQKQMANITQETGREFFSSYILCGWFLQELNKRVAKQFECDVALLPTGRLYLDQYLSLVGNLVLLALVQQVQSEGV
jgi:hypothetical protein